MARHTTARFQTILQNDELGGLVSTSVTLLCPLPFERYAQQHTQFALEWRNVPNYSCSHNGSLADHDLVLHGMHTWQHCIRTAFLRLGHRATR